VSKRILKKGKSYQILKTSFLLWGCDAVVVQVTTKTASKATSTAWYDSRRVKSVETAVSTWQS